MAALIPPLIDAQATDKAREMFQALQARLGMVPNIWRIMGHNPRVLQAALDLNKAVTAELEAKLRELAYLKVSQLNECHY
jgi:alkylhydroperoxidase family enzyme